MTISELKEHIIAELTKLARGLESPEPAVCASRTSSSRFFRPERKEATSSPKGVLEILARRLRLFCARPTTTISPARTHIRLALADSQVRPQNRRHHQRNVRPPRRGREVLRAGQDRGHQFESPEETRNKILFDNPPALPRGADQDGDRPRQCRVRHGPAHPGRQGPARADRRPAAARQDHAPAIDRKLRHHNHPEIVLIVLLIDEPRRGSPICSAVSKGEVISSTFDEPRPATSRSPRWSSRRPTLVEHKRLSSPAGLITRLARAYNTIVPPRAGSLRRRRFQRAATPQALLRRGPQHRGGRQPHHHRHRSGRHRLAHG